MSKKHIKSKIATPLCIATASVVWQVAYILFATITDFRERIIGYGLLGPNCGSCEAQTTNSIIVAIVIPLSIGALGFGFAVGKLLNKETTLVRYVVGILTGAGVFAFSYYAFGITNFLINF